MSEKISLDGSEGKDSQQSDENNTDNNYSENETEDVSTESDGKSERSHTDYYSNSTNSDIADIAIEKIEHVVTKEKDFMDYTTVIDSNVDVDDGGGGDSAIQKQASLQRTCCKLTNSVVYARQHIVLWTYRKYWNMLLVWIEEEEEEQTHIRVG